MKFDGKKIRKRLGWTLVSLATLLALFYAIENWRGARAWNTMHKRLVEGREPLTLDKLILPPVAPETNFGASTLIAALVEFEQVSSEDESDPGTKIVYRDESAREKVLTLQLPESDPAKNRRPDFAIRHLNRRIDLEAWVTFLEKDGSFKLGDPALSPPERILAAYEEFDPLLNEIVRAAKERPHSQFSLSVADNWLEMISMVMPHLHEINNLSKFIALKNEAALAAGKSDVARDGILVQIKLAEACGTQPTLISHLVSLAVLQLSFNNIWSGLEQGAWTNDDLILIDQFLAKFDLTSSALRGVRGELAFFLAGIHYMKTVSYRELSALMADEDWGWGVSIPSRLASNVIPSGWLDQNAALGSKLLFETCILPLKQRDFASENRPDALEMMGPTRPYNFYARMTVPVVESVLVRAVYAQSTLDMARTACALERFRLANGHFPEKLEDLPANILSSIPVDLISKTHPIYQKTDDGYDLYSVGWNQSDDDGEIILKDKKRQDLEEGDWVWSQKPSN